MELRALILKHDSKTMTNIANICAFNYQHFVCLINHCKVLLTFSYK
jgi:hypothetical protein